MADDQVPVHEGRRLDWHSRFDPASLDYPMAAGPATPLPIRGRLWTHGRVMDQGSEGACVGFGIAAELAAEPVPTRVTVATARSIYRKAQRRDPWPGEAYEGTSVLAGCLEGRDRGHYAGFRWAKRAEQLLAGIVEDGPAVIGVEWTEGSYATDELGILRPSGQVVGGHCVCVVGAVFPGDLTSNDAEARELREQLTELGLLDGLDVLFTVPGEQGAAIIVNSWGTSFGMDGLAVVPLSVLRGWVRGGGEFAQPQGRAVPGQRGAAVAEEQPQDEEQGEGIEEEQERGDITLHLTAAELETGDRITDGLPEDWPAESATVRGFRHVTGWGGRRVQVATRSGVVTLGAGLRVTVRRRR